MSMKHADHATPWTRAPSSSRPGWYACHPSLVLGTCFNARTIFKNKCELSHFGSSWVYKAQSHWCPRKESLISTTHPWRCLIKSLRKSHLRNLHSNLTSHNLYSVFTNKRHLRPWQTWRRLADWLNNAHLQYVEWVSRGTAAGLIEHAGSCNPVVVTGIRAPSFIET